MFLENSVFTSFYLFDPFIRVTHLQMHILSAIIIAIFILSAEFQSVVACKRMRREITKDNGRADHLDGDSSNGEYS